jgi:uncharacterized membrane protein YfcA
VTPAHAVLGALLGLAAGLMSGMLGVGGGIITTPGIQLLLGGAPYVAVGTPLPVIFPTAIVGAYTYFRGNELSTRAVTWAAGPGAIGAVSGAWLTSLIDPHWLLLLTAGLIGWQAMSIARGRRRTIRPRGEIPSWACAVVGLVTGFVSGFLGVGGGIVFVPLVTLLGMPLKRALGTSLAVIAIVAIPGTIVHAALGHVDWAIFLVLVVGVVPGARVGARIALETRERTLRRLVAGFLMVVAVGYGAVEVSHLLRG